MVNHNSGRHHEFLLVKAKCFTEYNVLARKHYASRFLPASRWLKL
jgi:hypothetical protein